MCCSEKRHKKYRPKPGRCDPKVTQNGKLRHFKQCQKIRKIQIFVVNTWHFYGTLHQKDILLFCVIEGYFSFINQESRG